MADRDQMVAFMSDLLEAGSYPDMLPVGLQVPGASDVSRVASGVSASLELFQQAAAGGAQMLLVHHGLFFGSGPRPPLRENDKARLKTLFDNDISLVAYHLALDAHAGVGNNAVICRLLGLEQPQPFGLVGARTIGFIGTTSDAISIGDLVERVREQITPAPLVFRDGPAQVRRVAVISGAASGELLAAVDAGADCFITGEPREQVMTEAREAGIHYIAAGHYATEVFGVRALGGLLADRFSVEHAFIDIPNPV
jgi:dinuclear metal center YbgI/SA1388 family protein